MIIKIIIGLLILFMVFNLFKAMMMMLKDEPDQPMSKYIGRRVLTSAIIVVLILIAIATGLITPNPSPIGR